MTRGEHLAWCKQRALEILDRGGDPSEAFASMVSDLRKHEELVAHAGIMLGAGLMMTRGWIQKAGEVRKWIEGFN